MRLTSEGSELFPAEPESSTPHRDKLEGLLANRKLPEGDQESVLQTRERYRAWIEAMDSLDAEGDKKVTALVDLLNDYKTFVELELIWDSEADFLFRSRGQLELDNSIIEEFLPRLVDPSIIPALGGKTYTAGPKTTFSAAL